MKWIATLAFALVCLGSAQAQAITCASLDPNGNPSNGGSMFSALSADGRWVVFESDSTDLVPGDFNGATDVFLRALDSGTTECLTCGSAVPSYRPAISGDGSVVSLTRGHDEGDAVVMTLDRRTGAWSTIAQGWCSALSWSGRVIAYQSDYGTWTWDRRTSVGERLDPYQAYPPSITPDGRFVGYSNVVDGRGYLYDRVSGARTDVAPEANNRTGRPAASADGRLVVFQSYATNLLPGVELPPYIWRAYVEDLWTGDIDLIAENTDFDPTITPDGRFVAFDSARPMPRYYRGFNVYRLDLWSLAEQRISIPAGSGYTVQPTISADGRTIAFWSNSPNLVPHDTNGETDVFVWKN